MLKAVAETEPENQKSVALIIAHPDDEILWAGGTILSHPAWKCFIVCLCRGNDTHRAPKFVQSLKALNAEGIMGDLDDGPEQLPLDEDEVAGLILNLLPPMHLDLVITHHPHGEYT
ncbi:MAG: PIG-L family deacetylase, partial [Bacteroidota bacterium]|nr:PIG-L family deacetylase [Bacteroidota bacterium]